MRFGNVLWRVWVAWLIGLISHTAAYGESPQAQAALPVASDPLPLAVDGFATPAPALRAAPTSSSSEPRSRARSSNPTLAAGESGASFSRRL